MRKMAVVLAICLGLILGSEVAADAGKRDRRIHHAVEIAVRQIGDPYVYGADGPNAFDCSGLTYFAYRERVGFNIPRTSRDLAMRARPIRKSHLKRGDFMFFNNGSRSSTYHVAIFLKWKHGRRVMLHAPRPGQTVHRDNPWTGQWDAGTLRRR